MYLVLIYVNFLVFPYLYNACVCVHECMYKQKHAPTPIITQTLTAMCQSTRTPSPYPISVFTEIPSLQRFLHECVLSKRFARASASMTNLVNFCDMLESFLAPDTHVGQVSLSLSLSLSLVSVSVCVSYLFVCLDHCHCLVVCSDCTFS